MNNPIHIALCADNNYAMPAGIMMYSVCRHTYNVMFHMVVSRDFSKRNIKKLESVVEPYNAKIDFIQAPSNLDSFCPVGSGNQAKHITVAAYFRLFLGALLPQELKKVIYLDCDLICMQSLDSLWKHDILGVPLAGVKDIPYDGKCEAVRLGYEEVLGYFNSGVLLVNLEYWRNNDVLSQFNSMIIRYPEKLQCHDQDVLNYVFRGKVGFIPPKYNAVDFLFSTMERSLPYDAYEIDEAKHSPVIVHFSYFRKPWIKGFGHPYKKRFLEYKKATPWRFYPLKLVKANNLKGRISNILVRIGIHEYVNDYIEIK